jgi:hypothetical protein
VARAHTHFTCSIPVVLLRFSMEFSVVCPGANGFGLVLLARRGAREGCFRLPGEESWRRAYLLKVGVEETNGLACSHGRLEGLYEELPYWEMEGRIYIKNRLYCRKDVYDSLGGVIRETGGILTLRSANWEYNLCQDAAGARDSEG